MIYYNEKSKRVNPFQKVYDSPLVKTIPNDIPTFPQFVDLELTNNCNMRCIMCPRGKAERNNGYMRKSIFIKVITECNKHHTPVRFIGWGEPLMHTDFDEYVNYVKSKKMLLHITTNGLLLNDTNIKSLLKVDSIIFSFQGTNQKQYMKMRKHDKYNEVKENILKLLKARGNKKLPFIHITTTTTIESSKEKQQFVDEFLPLVDAVSIGKTNVNIMPTITSYSPLLEIKQYCKLYERVPCTEVYHQIQVDWDGKVSPCCGDYDNYLTIGDVANDTIYDMWNYSINLKYIRELLKSKHHKMLTLCSRCYPTYNECD